MRSRSVFIVFVGLSGCLLTSREEYQELYARSLDVDQDGVLGPQAEGPDCDDFDPRVFPGGDELCNGVDDDCDGEIDEAGAWDAQVYYVDDDGDGYGEEGNWILACDRPEGMARTGGDCDDGDPAVNPGASEICDNGIDDDCDGGRGACVFSGDWTLGTRGVQLLGPTEGAEAGPVDRLDDLNGDGIADIVVGAPGYDGERGAAYLLYGPVTATQSLADADAELVSDDVGDRLGEEVFGLGDVFGTGRSAVAVAVPGDDTAATDGGAVLIFANPEYGEMQRFSARLRLYGDVADGGEFVHVASYGDLDGDEVPDIVVGLGLQTQDRLYGAGAVYLISADEYGDINLSSEDMVLAGEEQGLLGWDTSTLDIEGDGVADLAVSAAYQGRDGASLAGWVGCFQGPADALWHPDDAASSVWGREQQDLVGLRLTDGGGVDLDNDGHDDLLVGAATLLRGQGFGRIALLPGGEFYNGDIEGLPVVAYGESVLEFFGQDFELGDIDQDGHYDLLVGAPSAIVHGTGSGVAYVFYGPLSAGGDTHDADAVLLPPTGGEGAGRHLAVSSVADDWLLDTVVVGAPYASPWLVSQGVVYLEQMPGQ